MSDSLTPDDDDDAVEQQPYDFDRIKHALDAMGYDEAAQHIYGMDYPAWKQRHASKASDKQMEKFNASKPLWATHDKQVLAKRAESATTTTTTPASGVVVVGATNSSTGRTQQQSQQQRQPPPPTATPTPSLLSNVCCQSMEDDEDTNLLPPVPKQQPRIETTVVAPKAPLRTRQLPPYQPPALPTDLASFSLGILTVSDRASLGEYSTGDLSGPAVTAAVAEVLEGSTVRVTRTETAIVPDNMDAIATKLKEWSQSKSKTTSTTTAALDLILTTGGTGFSPRDVTPEATEQVIDQPCPGLIAFCTMECAKLQPLASLSRGTAGICGGTTLIANLPGNPKGVHEIIPILLPLALHAVADLKTTTV